MRFLSHLFLGLSIAGLFMLGCERHQFDDTKILHGDHGYHGKEHASDHSGEGDHGGKPADSHADKKAHHEEKPSVKESHDDDSKKKKEEPRDVGL
ncbi:MAG: hypothetical protein P1U58_11965 [Verrucomicrobiales bacterium]|nr:hypothetical protein [Verrucomicrobiales bacterium]